MIKINETNVTIMVADMDKAISFYESIGLTIKNRWGNHYAMLETTGITLGIHPKDEKQSSSSGTVSIGFMIDDFNEARALLDKNNILYEAQDDGKSGNYLHFKDLDGTILYFVQSKW
jgi:catechol 2,3-dioxygenase-like lactoylglutathione lyase family enzyme